MATSPTRRNSIEHSLAIPLKVAMDNSPLIDILSGHLLGNLNKERITKLAVEAVNDGAVLDALFQLMSDKNPSLRWRAAWALEKVSRLQPSLLQTSHREITEMAVSPDITDGHRRLLLSILYNLPNGEELDVKLFNYLLDKMTDLKSPSGVQGLSMKLASRMSLMNRDLHDEFLCIIRNMDLEYYSAGVKSVVRNCLKKKRS